jgi:chitin disaccharide deacetylase
MLNIIINADDCGFSPYVNSEIRKCIDEQIISSTTVMSNMDDFSGAVKLYQDYHNKISFGIHFNLTEGHPL